MEWESLRAIQNQWERIAKTYEWYNEDTRLTRSQAASVEYLTTLKYIHQAMPPSGRLLDVGAGTGIYSLHFAQKGYQVDALELCERNIALFQKKIQPHHSLSLRQGNAIDLSAYPSDYYDVVLVLGPLYHINGEQERKQCIDEALRVCKPGGTLFFAFISNDMVIATELMNDVTYLQGNTVDGNTFKVEDFPFVFCTVEHMRAHFRRQDVECVKEVASDGLSELLATQINAMEPAAFEQYLRYHFYCCEKPELLGFSNHLLWIGRKV